MLCPVCKVNLVMTDRQGIEIDYCPQCRGVWLDRGELDKIIERSGTPVAAGAAPPVRDVGSELELEARKRAMEQEYRNQERRYDHDDDDHHYDHKHGYKRKKKKGFLGELFDFD